MIPTYPAVAVRGVAATAAAAVAMDPNGTGTQLNVTTDNSGGGGDVFVSEDNLVLAAVLFAFCLATVLGNALVIAAVARERYLHTVTNYFITSLAVADCLVGSIVMPFSVAVEIQADRRWIFGRDLCDVWHSFDVLASTASILNLCVISMDRYWAITDPFTYPSRMTPKRAACFIALVWVCSSLISFPAIAWWRAVAVDVDGHPQRGSSAATVTLLDSGAVPRPSTPGQQCVFTDDVGYLVFSSTVSFYGPLSVMVFTYYRIYRAAVAQSRSIRLGIKQVVSSSGELGGPSGSAEAVELTLRIHRGGRAASDSRRCAAAAALLTYQASRQLGGGTSSGLDAAAATMGAGDGDGGGGGGGGSEGIATLSGSTVEVNGHGGRMPLSKMNFSLSRKLAKIAKERKAAKTLGIVMGVFIACWLPFFVTNLLSAFCLSCIHDPERVVTVVTWLGWINSGMNPVIYACWSRDFRRAFARIVCGCCPRLFYKWKRHNNKSGSVSPKSAGTGTVSSGTLTAPNSRPPTILLTTPSQLSPMAASLSFASLCHHQHSSARPM